MKFKRIDKQTESKIKNIQDRQKIQQQLVFYNNRNKLTANDIQVKQGLENKLKQLEIQYKGLR